MTRPRLSVVAPVFNEAATLEALAQRAATAAENAAPGAWEVLLVDDASTDATASLASSLPPGVHMLRLPANRGQLGATQHGLRAAAGEIVVVLDGDLQDPPEQIPVLVRALVTLPEVDVVYAARTRRVEPGWFLAGRAIYGQLQRLGRLPMPRGIGSYCAMRAEAARLAAAVALPGGTLAAVLTALGLPFARVPLPRDARAHGLSRVGPMGLAREAWRSLSVTGAAQTLGLIALGLSAVVAAALGSRHRGLALGAVLAAAAAATLGAAGTRRAAQAVRAARASPGGAAPDAAR